MQGFQHLAKVRLAGSNPVVCSKTALCALRRGGAPPSLQHAAGFGNLSRLSPRCPRLPYRSPTQLPNQSVEYRRGTAGTAVDHSYRRTQVI